MAFVRTWLMPRVAFWLLWTAWLWCLQSFLLARWEAAPGYLAPLFIVGPPILIAWIGSRIAKNPLESPNALFWKGAALSCLLGFFANMFLLRHPGQESHLLIGAGLICGYLGLRSPAVKKMALGQGELFDRAQFIARRTGVPLRSVVVFQSPKDLPSAFAQRSTGAILLSDRLLRLLSRRETEAVIAHEAAHLRALQRFAVSAIPLLMLFAIFLSVLWPPAKAAMPFVPLLSLLVWRALRRRQEYDADANAVANSDGEALITALTRIGTATGMPHHWGPLAAVFLPHPPMTARFRAIARRAGIAAARVDELIAAAGAIPSLPGFPSPFALSPSPEGLLSAHRERLDKRIKLVSKVFPILAGAAFAAVERFLAPDPLTLLAHATLWSAAAMLIFWIAYELVVGSERRRLRSQLPDAHRQGSFLVGISTAAEPRYYEGLYHYDVGLARIDGGSLSFAGTRSSFAIGSSEARRVWLAPGPRHWTPRKIVCIEYQMESGETGVVSLQSLERWFWPATSDAARDLFRTIEQWSKSGERPAMPAVPPPQVTGAILPRVRPVLAWKAMRIPCLISLCASYIIVQFSAVSLEGMLLPFTAPLVTAALIFFHLAPHLDWSHRRSPQKAPAQ